jgi:hypothetical protein
MAETVKKPTSKRSAKELRTTLFRIFDGFLNLPTKKFNLLFLGAK